jgi:hypothetical protein
LDDAAPAAAGAPNEEIQVRIATDIILGGIIAARLLACDNVTLLAPSTAWGDQI